MMNYDLSGEDKRLIWMLQNEKARLKAARAKAISDVAALTEEINNLSRVNMAETLELSVTEINRVLKNNSCIDRFKQEIPND